MQQQKIVKFLLKCDAKTLNYHEHPDQSAGISMDKEKKGVLERFVLFQKDWNS